MDGMETVLELAGYGALLFLLALIIKSIYQLTTPKRDKNPIKVGLELLLFFSTLLLLDLDWQRWIPDTLWHPAFDDLFDKASWTLWWLSLTFLVSNAIRRYLWGRMRTDRSATRVPKLLQDSIAFVLYLMAVMLIVRFVYDQPITALLGKRETSAPRHQ
ncbi:MAG: hypothetical protein HQL53_10505 [Magnetococcales bacterium]|nr:hypothetical protein [Magnetococcales bacterium]